MDPTFLNLLKGCSLGDLRDPSQLLERLSAR